MTQVSRWTRRLGVAAVATAAVTLAGTNPAVAAASPVGAAAAVASNTADMATAATNAAALNSSNPDITCTTPVVAGVAVTHATDLVVAEVKGTDEAAGAANCLSYQQSTYDMKLVIWIEYFDETKDEWYAICGFHGVNRVRNGVGVSVNAPVTCTYEPGDPPDGRPHRAHAILTNGIVAGAYESYSPVWLGGTGPAPSAGAPEADLPFTVST